MKKVEKKHFSHAMKFYNKHFFLHFFAILLNGNSMKIAYLNLL